ncbi:MAG: hypothetical protein BWY09_03057 [Candidatus Hydrogenedentes bacterium ADurb.Bin179]|nr:MAG: hypothetical protein BWY09_03057 [Candidatus Hydrogenedentes bacterium ADurb.Bin179]
MVQQTADKPQGILAEAGILVSREQRLVLFPQRKMHMHARPVVAEQGLGHERNRLPVAFGHILNDVLEQGQLVGHVGQRRKAQVYFRLACRCHFMVMTLHVQPAFQHDRYHFLAQVMLGIPRWHGKIPFLVPQFVTEIGLFGPSAVPDGLFAVNKVITALRLVVETDFIENEELRFRPHERGIGQAGRDEIVFGFLGDVARVPAVPLFGDRVQDIAIQKQGWNDGKGVDRRRPGIRQHQHITFVDGLPAADTGSVEAESFLEGVFRQLRRGNRKMLLKTRIIHES